MNGVFIHLLITLPGFLRGQKQFDLDALIRQPDWLHGAFFNASISDFTQLAPEG